MTNYIRQTRINTSETGTPTVINDAQVLAAYRRLIEKQGDASFPEIIVEMGDHAISHVTNKPISPEAVRWSLERSKEGQELLKTRQARREAHRSVPVILYREPGIIRYLYDQLDEVEVLRMEDIGTGRQLIQRDVYSGIFFPSAYRAGRVLFLEYNGLNILQAGVALDVSTLEKLPIVFRGFSLHRKPSYESNRTLKDPTHSVVWNQLGGRCVVCGKQADHIHEIVPRSKASRGWYAEDNRVTLCAEHHNQIHQEGPHNWEERLREFRSQFIERLSFSS